MSVSLLTVWRAARARAVPFAGESAGYLVLLACEEQSFAPRGVELSNIGLDEAGGVKLCGREPSDDARAERELRRVLSQLLEVASSPGLALIRAASRPCCGSIAAFGAELTKALIPLNRAAARRALNRLYRETERAEAAGVLALGEVPAVPATPSSATLVKAPAALPEPGPPVRADPSAAPALALAASSTLAVEPSPVLPITGVATPLPPLLFAVEPSPVVPVVATPLPPPLTFVSPRPPSVVSEGALRQVLAPSPKPPPVIERPARAQGASVRAHPELEHPTRPETLVARRRAGIVREREWTEPLPTPPRVPARVAEVEPLVIESERAPETPPLGSVAYGGLGPCEPLAFEAVSDDPTERAPVVTEEPRDGLEWPVELAVCSKAIPLEPERDALPSIPEPESYPGLGGEKSDVRSLLSGFQVEGALGENDLRGELKRFLGLDETPRPSTLRRR